MPYEQNDLIPDNAARSAIEYSADCGIPIIIGADSNALICEAHVSLNI